MKKISLVSLLFLFIIKANAQLGFGKVEDIQEIQSKTLLVVLDEKSEKLEKKIQKNPDKFKKYGEAINNYNSALKNAFESTWTFTDKIEFVTKSRFNEIKKDKSLKSKYAFFSNDINRSPSNLSNSSRAGTPDTYGFKLGLTDQKKSVYEMMFATIHPSEADLVMILQQFQNYINGRLKQKGKKQSRKEMKNEMKKMGNALKDKTLLIDEEMIDSKLKSQISKVYKYKYEITTKENIDKAIISKDSSIAYIRAIPFMQQSGGKNAGIKASKLKYIQYIFNAENGEILAFTAPPGMAVGGNLGVLTSSNNQKTTVKDLKTFTEFIN